MLAVSSRVTTAASRGNCANLIADLRALLLSLKAASLDISQVMTPLRDTKNLIHHEHRQTTKEYIRGGSICLKSPYHRTGTGGPTRHNTEDLGRNQDNLNTTLLADSHVRDTTIQKPIEIHRPYQKATEIQSNP